MGSDTCFYALEPVESLKVAKLRDVLRVRLVGHR